MIIEAPTSEALADWIESCVLVSRSGRFGLDKLYELANLELGATELEISGALSVIGRRAELLGDLYPFAPNQLAVLSRPDSPFRWDYAALLCLTPGSPARQTVRALETSEMAEILEEIASRALSNFWGPGGHALRFAYPSNGRPENFGQAILWLARRIGLDPGSGYRPPRRKDGGVDVVAWRQFMDKRPGFPIALAQCTIQRETFTKTTDIDVRLWSSWLAMDMDPLSLLVIPGTVRRPGPEWKQLTTVVLVIERLRLMELLGRAGVDDIRPPLLWTEDTINSLRNVMLAGEY